MNTIDCENISKAISTLSVDRAALHILEDIVQKSSSSGALLLVPHTELREMIPILETFTKNFKPTLDKSFLCNCYKYYLNAASIMLNYQELKRIGFKFEESETTALIAPAKYSNKVIALIVVFKIINSDLAKQNLSEINQYKFFDDTTLKLVEIVAPLVAILIENFLMHSEIIYKDSRLSALYEISQTTKTLIDLRDINDSVEKTVRSYIDFDGFVFYTLLDDKETLEARKEYNSTGFPQRLKLGEHEIGKAAQERKPCLTYSSNFNSILILPIEYAGELLGAIALGSKRSYAYSDEDIIGLRILITQICSLDQLYKDLIRLRGFTQNILESMNSGVIIFDNSGVLTYANPEMTKILAQPISEGWSLANVNLPIPKPLNDILNQVLQQKVSIENAKVHLDDFSPPKILEVNAFPFRDEHGIMLGIAAFVKDITQIIRLEDQLKRADRLSAIGVLAAGIAHEIRNPLTGIKMIVHLLMADMPPDDHRIEPISMIQREIERLEKIIVNLLDFAKPVKPKLEKVNIPEIIDNCLLLVQNQIKKMELTLQKDYPSNFPQIIADPSQLKQVFLNIITNAIQASYKGGLINISLGNSDKEVWIAIKDTGIGIAQDKIKSIFDPFMTTKEEGTGLGLPLAQRIVDEHGGRIEVESKLGAGATFTIYLPLVIETSKFNEFQ